MPVLKKILTYALIFVCLAGNAQDTIPPQLILPARDTFFECGQVNMLIDNLTNWYQSAGGAIFEDDSDDYTISANPSLNQAITIFNNSRGSLCGNTQKVEVVFTAVDDSGNVSLPDTASFYTIDTTPPSLNTVESVEYSCTEGIRDTLIAWIQNKAGYVAADLCSDTVLWTTFTFGFFVEDVQISGGSGNISSGPYPQIPSGICEWAMKINFFVKDGCGNQTVTPGFTQFKVTDNEPPAFIDFPEDITVECHEIPDAIPPSVIDYCTIDIVPTLVETSTQDPDPLSCGHYNYKLTRLWTAVDNCNNTAQKQQVITIQDTRAPIIGLPSDNVTDCHIFYNHQDSIYMDFEDSCSPVSISFTENIEKHNCVDTVFRTYIVRDVCNNTAEFNQILEVYQRTGPLITQPAQNKAFNCDTTDDLNAELFVWVQNMGNSEATALCGDLKSFAAIKDSYNINDSSSYPGVYPTVVPEQECPSGLKGWLNYVEVDFVYFDDCGNYSITPGIFGILDTIAPIIESGPESISLNTLDGCSINVKIKTPEVIDNCAESSFLIKRKVRAEITSQDPPGPEAVVDALTVKVGPLNPYVSEPINDGIITVRLINMDIDDPTEYFNIYDEDGTFIRKSPQGPSQCTTVEFDLQLDQNKIADWIQDGYIDITFVPFVIESDPVFAINNICNGSSIEVQLEYPTDISNTIRSYYQLNNNDLIAYNNIDSIELSLEKGENHVKFYFYDCADNESKWEAIYDITDDIAPILTCPENLTSDLPLDECSDLIKIPLLNKVLDNCGGNRVYDVVSPSSNEASYLSFAYNSATGNHQARNKQIVFNNLFPIRFSNQPVLLRVEFYGDNNEANKYFEIYSPTGDYLGSTTIVNGPGCTTKSITDIYLSVEQFNNWISDNTIAFSAVPVNIGDGIKPCLELIEENSIDNISYLKGRLKYSDFTFWYNVNGATIIDETQVSETNEYVEVNLNSGKNFLTLYTEDGSGNQGSCEFEIQLIDIQKPTSLCKNGTITVHPSGIESSILFPEYIDNGSFDNCSGIQLSVHPIQFDCSMVGTDVPVVLTAVDNQGNQSSCSTTVRVKSYELQPTFSSGLCSNDTLKLFANMPETTTQNAYTFRWQGPGNIELFTENPEIPNVDESYNGTWILTATGFNGCISIGSVLVNVQPLTNPSLTANESEACLGDDIVLSSTQYSGGVNYDWYEGIFPTGVLIRSTSTAETIITPVTSGPHFYYVIARGPDCSSNPSSLLKITLKEVPIASVLDLYLSPCEGGEVVLGSSTFNPDYTYSWTGPRGYTANGANPSAITDVTFENSGKYLLVVRNGSCVSDTAVTRVDIFESPETPIITGLNIFCEGEVFTLVATSSPGSEKYQWYKDGILYTVTQDNSLIIPNSDISLQGDWTVIAIKGNCSSKISNIKSVGIDISLQIGVINSGPVCAGDSITLQATFVPNATYIWSGPVSNIPDVYNPIIDGIPGDYSVTITTPTGCSSSSSTTVVLVPIPEITALSSSAMPCMHPNDILTFQPSVFPNSSDYSYEWKGPDNFTSNSKSPQITPLDESKRGIYILNILNGKCKSQPFILNVQFDIIPEKPKIISSHYLCVGDPLKLEIDTAYSDASYEWDTPLGTIITEDNQLASGINFPPTEGQYRVRIIKGDCSSDFSEPIEIAFRNKPEAPILDAPSFICYGDSLIIMPQITEEGDYLWHGPNGTEYSGSPLIIPNATAENSGEYFSYITVNGCSSLPSEPLSILVKEKITTPELTEDNVTVCSTENSFIELCLVPTTLTPGATYYVSEFQSNNTLTSSNNTCQLVPVAGLLETGIHFLSISSSFDGCLSEKSMPVVVDVVSPPNVRAEAAENDIIVCPDESIRLISRHEPPLVNILWTTDSDEIEIDDDSAVSPLISGLPAGNTQIFLSYSVNGCPDFSKDTINIYTEFLPEAEDDSYHLQYGQNGLFNILENDLFPDNGIITITSSPQKGTIQITEDNNIEFFPDPRSLNAVTFKYKICASFCENLCDEAQVFITFDDDIECYAPSIFTPNGDGINDYFIIPCLETGRFPNNKVIVFNEWGLEVFSAQPYNNDWDGTYGNNPLPVGTYFYIIEVEHGKKPINGFLILQR